MKCTARKKNGHPCKAWAIKGTNVCRTHGGMRKQTREAGRRRIAEAKAAKAMRLLAKPVEIDPGQALLELVQWTAGEVRYWRSEVERIANENPNNLAWGRTKHTEGEGPEGYVNQLVEEATPPVEYQLLMSAQERLAKFATAALRAGVEERRIRLAEDQGALIAQVIRGIFEDLNLTPEQRAISGEVAARHLRLVAG